MKNVKFLIAISALFLSTSSAFAMSHAGAPMAKESAKTVAVTSAPEDMADGEVKKINKGNKKITLMHGVIKNLDMSGMTMVFGVKDAALLNNLEVGDKIKFKAEQTDTTIVVTWIQLVK